jgi:hypothetical protein
MDVGMLVCVRNAWDGFVSRAPSLDTVEDDADQNYEED